MNVVSRIRNGYRWTYAISIQFMWPEWEGYATVHIAAPVRKLL